MKITKIKYKMVVNGREKFCFNHFEAEAEVGANESPEAASAKLQAFVESQVYDTIETVTVEKVPRRRGGFSG